MKNAGLTFAGVLLATTALGCISAAASNCDSLSGIPLPVPNTTITAQEVPAGSFMGQDNLPAFCRVVGISKPRPTSNIGFEVWMPISGWNHKFEQVGNGGLAGSIQYGGIAIALRQGYASASTDDGTAGDIPDFLLDTNKVLDWRINAVHETAENSQAIIQAFYGGAPRHAYFTGCSKGGSEAATEMQRFPDDFDGIVGGATAFYSTHNLVRQVYNIVTVNGSASNTTPVLDENALTILHNGVLDACGRQEGTLQTDIWLNDPRDCHFNPQVLQCKQGQNPSTCLSPDQVAAAQKMYEPLYNATGQEIFPGEPRGQEAPPANPNIASGNLYGWQGFSPVEPPAFWLGGPLTLPQIGGLVFGDLNYTYADFFNFDFTNDTAMLDARYGSGPNNYNTINTDLRAFENRGGKAIFYHGWGDILVYPKAGYQYYDSVITAQRAEKGLGSDREALNATENFFRYFMVPGMGHCLSGPGANVFNGANNPGNPQDPEHDVVAAVDRWVDQGIPPAKIIATKFADDVPANGDVAFTRPLCPYPQVALYKGTGNPNDAANFQCVEDNDDLSTDIQEAGKLYSIPSQ
ncbi:MAG: tannase/feruloyl esterase family alpha/beta hydrolase [Acidobacteria bacterium]|nr:tannase/feruloyl esterase family alpha/beta hydrolase [Acidobacteriota bacterium]